jgi:uncharacterized protein
VATDDLNAPLGLKKKQARFRLPPYAAPATAGLLGVIIATFAIWALFNNDPLGGEPMDVVKVDLSADGGAASERKPIVVSKADSPAAARTAGTPEGDARAKPPEKSENGPQEKAGGRNE